MFIPAVGDTVSSSSMMVLFYCSEIRRSERMNVKTGREGQGEMKVRGNKERARGEGDGGKG